MIEIKSLSLSLSLHTLSALTAVSKLTSLSTCDYSVNTRKIIQNKQETKLHAYLIVAHVKIAIRSQEYRSTNHTGFHRQSAIKHRMI